MTTRLFMSDVPTYSSSQHITFTGQDDCSIILQKSMISMWNAVIFCTVTERNAGTTQMAKS